MKKCLSLNNYFNTIFLIILFFALSNCKSKTLSFLSNTIEPQILTKIFLSDSVKVYYKDYSDLKNIKPSFIPISDRYSKSISVQKYINDTSITKYVSIKNINNYAKNLGKDTLIPKQQYGDLKGALFDSKRLNSFVWANKTSKYISLSKPIFSDDFKYVMVEINYICFGLCGEGYTYVLKKQNNDWILYKKILRWIS